MTKRIVVTGASSGIGRETAIALAKAGHQLVLASRRQGLLLELMEECRAADIVHTVTCDVTCPDECRALVEEAMKLGGEVEPVLVNAAGMAEFGDFQAMPWPSVEGQIATNLLGPLAICQAIVPWMLSVGRGQIINVLSVAASHPFPGAVAYAASKAGLLMAGKCLAAEYRARGIRVTSLLPGATDTPLWGPGGPAREDMLSPSAVARAIADLIDLPPDRNVDEMVLMPPKGVL